MIRSAAFSLVFSILSIASSAQDDTVTQEYTIDADTLKTEYKEKIISRALTYTADRSSEKHQESLRRTYLHELTRNHNLRQTALVLTDEDKDILTNKAEAKEYKQAKAYFASIKERHGTKKAVIRSRSILIYLQIATIEHFNELKDPNSLDKLFCIKMAAHVSHEISRKLVANNNRRARLVLQRWDLLPKLSLKNIKIHDGTRFIDEKGKVQDWIIHKHGRKSSKYIAMAPVKLAGKYYAIPTKPERDRYLVVISAKDAKSQFGVGK